MVRSASQEEPNYGGLYRYLLEAEEKRFACNDYRPRSEPYYRRRILDDLRAGRPVNVPSGELPLWTRQGAPTRRGRFGLAVIHPCRAIVRPDDTIVWSDADWARLFLEEIGEL